MWTIDAMSGKSVPGTSVEWLNFIGAKQLAINPPDSLWLMQDTSGSLQDSIGDVDLASVGNDSAKYQQSITGWERKAITSADGAGVLFSNTTAAALPNVGNASMTVLMLYATVGTPGGTRSIVVAGCCTGYATLSVNAARRFLFQVNTTGNATGLVDYGSDVTPIVVKLDKLSSRQVIITDRETVMPMFTQLEPYKGLLLGAANGAAPEGRWLYMAAWYGANAEMLDAHITALIKALGW